MQRELEDVRDASIRDIGLALDIKRADLARYPEEKKPEMRRWIRP